MKGNYHKVSNKGKLLSTNTNTNMSHNKLTSVNGTGNGNGPSGQSLSSATAIGTSTPIVLLNNSQKLQEALPMLISPSWQRRLHGMSTLKELLAEKKIYNSGNLSSSSISSGQKSVSANNNTVTGVNRKERLLDDKNAAS